MVGSGAWGRNVKWDFEASGIGRTDFSKSGDVSLLSVQQSPHWSAIQFDTSVVFMLDHC